MDTTKKIKRQLNIKPISEEEANRRGVCILISNIGSDNPTVTFINSLNNTIMTTTALGQIKAQQQLWAKRKGCILVSGTIGKNGEKSYFEKYDDNLFVTLSEISKKAFENGNGNELVDTKERRAKMKALISSSAIAVNFCQYWETKKDISPLLQALGLIMDLEGLKFRFEEKLKIKKSGRYANIDIAIENAQEIVAIESKFTEPYRSSKSKYEIKEVYKKALKEEKIEGLLNLVENLSQFKHLDVPQLIKHILALKTKVEQGENKTFTLLYLWYDVLGKEGARHREEIEKFKKLVWDEAHIKVKHITYQEVIRNLAKLLENSTDERDKDYINYLTDRYL